MFNGLTPTVVLRYLNRMLGAAVQELELSSEEMMRVVFQESLPTFSKYFPYRYKEVLKVEDSLGAPYENTYKIPNEDKLEIIGIGRVLLDNMNQFGGSLLPLSNDPFASQLLNDYLSATITPTTFNFQAPNLVTIYPKIYRNTGALIEVKACHPEHLRTIPINMRDEFLNLCLYDVLLSLYPIRHRFASLQTTYGNLDLFIDMVDSAKDDKAALLEKWRENVLKQANTKKIWVG